MNTRGSLRTGAPRAPWAAKAPVTTSAQEKGGWALGGRRAGGPFTGGQMEKPVLFS